MRIALAQINTTVGDVKGNVALIRRDIAAAREQNVDLIVFPELAVIGYPPKDLLLKPRAIEQCMDAMDEIARDCDGIAALVGYPRPSTTPRGRVLFNAAGLCADGKLQHTYVKRLLPTYDVFDELRYFEPGDADHAEIAEFQGTRIGVTICEDLWNDDELFERQLYHDEPIRAIAELGAQMVINCSASPFVVGKHAFRLSLFRNAAKKFKMPVVYCNSVGGNDELVFDGNSCVIDVNGEVVAQAKDFEEDLLIVDLPTDGSPAKPARIETPRESMASVYEALVMGIRDYCRKCGFKTIVMGLSGGIDSALTAALCAAAIGGENIRGVTMPSRYSSEGSVADAKELADRLGIDFHIVAIGDPHGALEELLTPHFDGRDADVTEENMQARLRGVILMSFSNKFGSLLVTTGNKSELAVGYCTLYGDMCGGLAALSDVPKTMVWELSRWINESPDSPLLRQFGKAVIPENSITKPPSAELRPDQVDQDSLPPYDVLDDIIERWVEHDQPTQQIIDETGYDADVVLRMLRLIDRNEYKRKQAAPGLKITGRAFGFGRRMPIAQRYDDRGAVREPAAASE